MAKEKEPDSTEAGKLIHELEVALDAQRGVDVAVKIDRVLEAGAWKTFTRPYEKTERRFENFASFIADRKGLGLTPDQLRFFCTSTPRILNDLDTLIKTGGVPVPSTPSDARQRALARLREERPDLHKQVVKGDLSPYAATIEAGFRKRTAAVPVDDVEAVARFLQKRFSKGKLRKLIEILSE